MRVTTNTNVTDYSSAIRAEIERDVSRLIERCWNQIKQFEADDWWLNQDRGSIVPVVVWIGALVNTHHGKDLYKDGDKICGVPVRIDRSYVRTITVSMGDIEFATESWADDDDDDRITHDVYETKRIEASMEW